MALKKKKGSSMIMLLIIFALIAIFGTAILALTAAGYSMRIVASKQTQNLYAADSGINTIQGIVKKEVEYAVVDGNKKAADYLKNDANKDKSILKEDGKTVDEDKLYAAANSKFKNAYKNYITAYLNKRDDNDNIARGIYTDSDGKKDLFADLQDKPKIDMPADVSFNEENKIDLKVVSTFATEVKRGETSNKKTVSAHIIIAVPDYGDTYSITTKESEIQSNPVWQNAVAIDGNMHLNGRMEFDGDLFVRGINNLSTEQQLNNISYAKYNGGISIGSDTAKESSNINFNSGCKVVTVNSFCINGSNNEVNAGDIYAGNFYIGNASKDTLTVSQSNGITCQNVYLNNDLSLNSEKTRIDISQFYGINDITSSVNSIDNSNYKSSSSIIVNSDDIGNGSSINIANKAVIMGTAYIDTKPEAYQTAESVAVKGNYMSYGIHIPDSLKAQDSEIQKLIDMYKESKVNFAYINPLMLIKSLKLNSDKEITLQQKIDYFKLCQKLGLSANGASIKSSGINLPGGSGSVISYGLAPKSGSSNFDTSYKAEDQSIVAEKQKQIAEKVYEMSAPEESYATPADKLYSQGNQDRVVMDGNRRRETDPATGYQTNTVAQVAFVDSSGNEKTYDVKKIDYANNSVVYVNNTNSDVILLGRNSNYKCDEKADNVIDLKNMSSGSSSGVIVVKGNVHLYGDIDYTGCIIAGGDFTAEDNAEVKKIRWDNSKVKQLIAANYDGLFENIFINNTGSLDGSSFNVNTEAGEAGYEINDDVVKLSEWRMEH